MFKSKIADTEKAMLINSFPASLRQEVEEVIKILPFDRQVLLADRKNHNVDSLVHIIVGSSFADRADAGLQKNYPEYSHYTKPLS